MFSTVNPRINEYMQRDHDSMRQGILFVVASIKTPFYMMAKQMQDIGVNGVNSKYLWGFKKDAYEYLSEHSSDLYDELMDHYQQKYQGQWSGYALKIERDRRMMLILTDVPGLGLAKAGFVMQLMFGRVGCIDVHNLRRLTSVSAKDLVFNNHASDKIKYQKIDNYLNICKGYNNAERLWDKWCDQVAYNPCNRKHFTDGNDVSQFHYTSIAG